MRLYPSLAEGTGLENRKASQGVRGVESLEPRHLEDRTSLLGVMFFCAFTVFCSYCVRNAIIILVDAKGEGKCDMMG